MLSCCCNSVPQLSTVGVSPSVCSCTLTNAFHRVRGLCVWPFFFLLRHHIGSHTASSEASMLSKTEIMVMHVTQSDFVFVVLSCGDRATWQLFVVFSCGELLGSCGELLGSCLLFSAIESYLAAVCCFQQWRATWWWARTDKWVCGNACWRCTVQSLCLFSAVESYLAVGKDGQLGVTGEGSMLENASGEWTKYKL